MNTPKFPLNSRVWHEKTGRTYKIVGTPDEMRIESSAEPAYAYTLSPPELMKPYYVWVRPQSEMEDGRFKAV